MTFRFSEQSHTFFQTVNFFFFNDTATTEIYTLSLHDALPISLFLHVLDVPRAPQPVPGGPLRPARGDRKSTRLNSSHANISYAVFCLKKKQLRQLRSTPAKGSPTKNQHHQPTPYFST